MTDRQLRDEVVTLILAGHETTALVLFYAFYLLAQSPATRGSPRGRAARRTRRPVPDRCRCSQLTVHGVGRPGIDAAVSAGLGNRPRGFGRLRDRRLPRPQGNAALHGSAAGPPRRPLVRRSGDIQARALGSRSHQATAPMRVFSLRRRSAHLHRQSFRDDGGSALSWRRSYRRFRPMIEPGQTLELLPSITLRPRYPIKMRLVANEVYTARAPNSDVSGVASSHEAAAREPRPGWSVKRPGRGQCVSAQAENWGSAHQPGVLRGIGGGAGIVRVGAVPPVPGEGVTVGAGVAP